MLTQREIANQEKATFEEQQRARDVARSRWRRPRAPPTCRRSSRSAQVGIEIKTNEAAGPRSAGAG